MNLYYSIISGRGMIDGRRLFFCSVPTVPIEGKEAGFGPVFGFKNQKTGGPLDLNRKKSNG